MGIVDPTHVSPEGPSDPLKDLQKTLLTDVTARFRLVLNLAQEQSVNGETEDALATIKVFERDLENTSQLEEMQSHKKTLRVWALQANLIKIEAQRVGRDFEGVLHSCEQGFENCHVGDHALSRFEGRAKAELYYSKILAFYHLGNFEQFFQTYVHWKDSEEACLIDENISSSKVKIDKLMEAAKELREPLTAFRSLRKDFRSQPEQWERFLAEFAAVNTQLLDFPDLPQVYREELLLHEAVAVTFAARESEDRERIEEFSRAAALFSLLEKTARALPVKSFADHMRAYCEYEETAETEALEYFAKFPLPRSSEQLRPFLRRGLDAVFQVAESLSERRLFKLKA